MKAQAFAETTAGALVLSALALGIVAILTLAVRAREAQEPRIVTTETIEDAYGRFSYVVDTKAKYGVEDHLRTVRERLPADMLEPERK